MAVLHVEARDRPVNIRIEFLSTKYLKTHYLLNKESEMASAKSACLCAAFCLVKNQNMLPLPYTHH